LGVVRKRGVFRRRDRWAAGGLRLASRRGGNGRCLLRWSPSALNFTSGAKAPASFDGSMPGLKPGLPHGLNIAVFCACRNGIPGRGGFLRFAAGDDVEEGRCARQRVWSRRAARMDSSSPVPTTASTSGMDFWIFRRGDAARAEGNPATMSLRAEPEVLKRAMFEDGIDGFLLGVSMKLQVLTMRISASSG